jgi:predicted DNA-binding transcriptional regulator AlpA
MTTLPALADVADVASWLHTTKKAIYAMVERRQLPGVIRVQRRILFDRAALVTWIEQRRAVSSEES